MTRGSKARPGCWSSRLIQPENFDQRFYSNFVEKIFTQVIPWPVNVLAGADSGIVLVDPDKPYQQQRYDPGG